MGSNFSDEFKNAIQVRIKQTKILLKKNWIITKRNKRSTIIQILVPFLFILFLFILQLGLNANSSLGPEFKNVETPSREPFQSIPRCIKGVGIDKCWTIAYVTNNPIGDDYIAKNNDVPMDEVISFNNTDLMDVFLDSHRNTTQGAYIFNFTSNANGRFDLNYTIQYNDTETYDATTYNTVYPFIYTVAPFQYNLLKVHGNYGNETLLIKAMNMSGDPNFKYNIDTTAYPHPQMLSTDVIRNNGPAFFFGAMMFNFVIQIGQIVTEKENKLREGMNTMGLKDFVFWFTWWVTNTILNVISVLVLIVSGYIFQFDFFLKNDFGTFFFLFLLFGIAMVPAAFFVTTLVKKSQNANSLGFVIFLVGIIIQGFVALAFTPSFYKWLRVIFSFLPFVLLAKGMSDLGDMSAIGKDGLRWANRGNNAWFSLNDVYAWLILDFFLYWVLALYLDNVLTNTYGVRKPFYFFLMPSFWRSKKRSNNEKDRAKTIAVKSEDDKLDEDVEREKQNVLNGALPNSTQVTLYNLRKVYQNGLFKDPKKDFVAVKGSTFHIEAGQLFCLLGHNGAGKTTTISMLTGLFHPSSGDAIILGNSIIDGMEDIRKVMGVCPQHDILWDQLTGREHLEMFAAFKGLKKEEIEGEVHDRLKDVDLLYAADQYSSMYSGGMKRRLSTAIALTANPQIVFLDEPTTGMDPVSRRHVWDLIEKVKRDRVIILTTHSMEEADILGDMIGNARFYVTLNIEAIMKKGGIEAYGTSLRLKSKYGAGYRISVLADEKSIGEVTEFLGKLLGLSPAGKGSTFVDFNIPRPLLKELPSFFEQLEAVKEKLGITDVQLSMTTLEEVFLTIAGHD